MERAMATCKYCGEYITWEYDPDEAQDGKSGWIPLDEETGERHMCCASDTTVCKYCGEEIYWEEVDSRWVPSDIVTRGNVTQFERHQCGVEAARSRLRAMTRGHD